MNAPWWRIKTDQQSPESTLAKSKSNETDEDLLPPFVD